MGFKAAKSDFVARNFAQVSEEIFSKRLHEKSRAWRLSDETRAVGDAFGESADEEDFEKV